jgi:hypothetical protein
MCGKPARRNWLCLVQTNSLKNERDSSSDNSDIHMRSSDGAAMTDDRNFGI